MSLNIAELRNRVAAEAGFSAVEQVNDSTIRSTRKAGDLRFAVYYFDIAQVLPGTQEMLTKYQDRVIGRRYFEGSKSLQWSNYLYFITSEDRLVSGELGQAKELIERDRNYARKFVISEEELESVLRPPVVAPSDAVLQASILSVWTDLLIKAGLDRAILTDKDLPTRLKLIEASPTAPDIGPVAPKSSEEVMAAPFIRSLLLKEFRRPPLQRRFDFGTVNLISGANGSGKTSMLEAIELFYCGRNKRNPNDSLPYELVAVLSDGQTENATDGRKARVYRERNLGWYGQAEIKTNELYLSFAQFNFLDTDAAVSLAESTSRIEEDLAKLLVGADASKTWHNIERVDEAVVAKLRELRPREHQIKEELDLLRHQRKEASGLKQESDSIRVRLEEMVHRLGWAAEQVNKDVFAGSIVESLSELESLAQQAASLGWTQSPVSIDGLTKYFGEAKITSEKAETDITHLELLRKDEKRMADAGKRGQEALNLAAQAKRFIDAGLPIRMREVDRLQTTVAKYSGWLAGLKESAMGVLLTGNQDAVLTNYCDAARLKRSAAEALLLSTKSELENFSKMRDESLHLAQRLRETAARILGMSAKPDECPLCHTQFSAGELAKHINRGVDEPLEAVAQKLLIQFRERETELSDAVAADVVSDWLRKFCERASLAAGISVHSALMEVESAKRTLTEARSRMETLNSELIALESQGFVAAQMGDILVRLAKLGDPPVELSLEAVERRVSAINQDLASLSQNLQAKRKEADEVQQALEVDLGSKGSTIQALKSAVSQLKERCTTTESLRGKLLSFSATFPWPDGRPLAELAVEAAAVRKVAAGLQTAQGRERQANGIYSESAKREEQLVNQLSRLSQRIKRLTDAETAFKTIRDMHSLAAAMESALGRNRAGIETIFLRIHSPADFRGLGPDLTTLVRRVDGKLSRLSQISTGQRSALALSIFLAQNAQLKVGPPVVLIDDPLAHVDDLNALSFLDYLREVVLAGRRQIFFATANDKLATLFERKFDFLGKTDFRRFDLYRGAQLATIR